MASKQILIILAAVAAALFNYIGVSQRFETLGIGRGLSQMIVKSGIENIHGEDFYIIPDTMHCEDLHHHAPSGLLFGAAESNAEDRWKWFPPIEKFDYTAAVHQGNIIVIDPRTKTSKRLSMPNFKGPFITHGIDIWYPSNEPNELYIFAINHLANPAHVASSGKIGPAARSQIELFKHFIGTTEIEYMRSIWHPAVHTPNDIYACDPMSLYVTNDHYNREGLKRSVEDIFSFNAAWSDVIHLIFTPSGKGEFEMITASRAVEGINNPNGLGHGKNKDEVLINRAAAGILEIARPDYDNPYPIVWNPIYKDGSDREDTELRWVRDKVHTTEVKNYLPRLNITNTVQFPNTVDNPSYFRDPYAKQTGRDASGYVIAGLVLSSKFPNPTGDPSNVWLVQPGGAGTDSSKWTRKLIFQDDGKTVSTASTAVLVAIDPTENGGKKQAWLFVTGPMTAGVASMKIDL